MFRFVSLLAVSLCLVAGPAQARDYGNVAGWELASSGESCGLYSNQSGAGEIIILKRLDGALHVQVSNKRWNTAEGDEVHYNVDGKVWGGDFGSAPIRDANGRGYISAFSSSFVGLLRGGSQLMVKKGDQALGIFSLKGSSIALNRMESCLADLRRDGPAEIVSAIPLPTKSKSAVPRNAKGRWFNFNDYPSRAQSEGRAGTVVFRLTVGANGRVSDCQIVQSSGHRDIDASTCKAASKRARFDPALDDEGNPAVGSYQSRVTWSVPK